jgi:hypothetical protein
MKKLRNEWKVLDLLPNESNTFPSSTIQEEQIKDPIISHHLDNLPKLKNVITCGICMDIFAIPHILECGHSYCFFCLQSWFLKGRNEQKSLQCPCCRHCLTTPPYQNLAMQEFIEVHLRILIISGDDSNIWTRRNDFSFDQY